MGCSGRFPFRTWWTPSTRTQALLQYLAYDQDKVEKVLENPTLLRTPIVRNGKQATVGYQPEQWKTWE